VNIIVLYSFEIPHLKNYGYGKLLLKMDFWLA